MSEDTAANPPAPVPFDPSAYPDPEHVVHEDVDALAAAAAAAIAAILADTRERLGRPGRVSLTGGGAGLRTARELAALEIDWSGVEIHFGDERFVARDDPERNSTQIAAALPAAFGAATVVDWPAPGDRGAQDVDEAAASFAAAHPLPAGDEPYFDAFCLGMGGEGHVNSVFPDSPQVLAGEDGHAAEDIMAVHDCPKPPPERMTYTLGVVRRSRNVLLLVAGEEKAEAVAAASAAGADPVQWPAAGARGLEATTWYLDRGSASRL
ncbi:6-phosphogluconolactonase [Dietzia sp.]|uniref:6-phosphogluconolactonase n=1 Tax=Dietzia sp. TaxID=1871616 RepID=UPI002FDB3673